MSHPNIDLLETVANELPEDLLEQVVFVGGSTIGLFLDEPGLAELRPTEDVDLVVEADSRGSYYKFIEKIKEAGFNQIMGDPIYRYRKNVDDQELIIDVLSSSAGAIDFTNTWYKKGMEKAKIEVLPRGKRIRVFSLIYTIASKIEAFNDRGANDPYASEDLEDIVALIDSAQNLKRDLKSSDEEVKGFIIANLNNLLENDETKQALEGHAPSGSNIIAKINSLLS